MSRTTVTCGDDGAITIRIPMAFRKRGGRKLVIAPDGAEWTLPRSRVDSTMVKALARAHRWKRMLESSKFSSVTELAEAEKISLSYLCLVLKLTLLTPSIVEAILDGQQPPGLQLDVLFKPFPIEWDLQQQLVGPTTRRPEFQTHSSQPIHSSPLPFARK